MKPNIVNDDAPKLKDLRLMALSIIAVVVVMLITFGKLGSEISDILILIDWSICIIFIGNFFFDLAGSENRKRYILVHWIDLIASIPVLAILIISAIPAISAIPVIDFFRYVRVFQLLRVVRLIMIGRRLLPLLKEHKKETALTVLMLTMITIITLASALILLAEHDAPMDDARIDSVEKAIWWAFVTISTVGYGDYYPVTLGGRVIAALLIFVGVAFFSAAAGFIASKFVVGWSRHGGVKALQRENELLEEIRQLQKKLDSRDN